MIESKRRYIIKTIYMKPFRPTALKKHIEQPEEEIPAGKKKFVLPGDFKFIVDEQYQVEKVVGRGGYSTVAQGFDRLTNRKVAIKKIEDLYLHNLGKSKRTLREIKILKFLEHPNIITLNNIMRIKHVDTYSQIYICMQFMKFNLHSFIHGYKKAITDEMIKCIIFQLLRGLHYLHSANIIHRDLKPQNILMNGIKDIKIADMNLAKNQNSYLTTYIASKPYRAPEIIISDKVYNSSIDIWSIGCILAELIGRTILFNGKDELEIVKKMIAILGKPPVEMFQKLSPFQSNISSFIEEIPNREKINWKYLFEDANEQALDLLDNMLMYNPQKRYTAEQSNYANLPRKVCDKVINFEFDLEDTEEAFRRGIYDEVQDYQEKRSHLSKEQEDKQRGKQQENEEKEKEKEEGKEKEEENKEKMEVEGNGQKTEENNQNVEQPQGRKIVKLQ